MAISGTFMPLVGTTAAKCHKALQLLSSTNCVQQMHCIRADIKPFDYNTHKPFQVSTVTKWTVSESGESPVA
jgi:hypothetical protein